MANLPVPSRPTRALLASLVCLSAVLGITLNPDATRVQAAGMFGSLRAPGDPAFVAAHRGDRSAAPENTMPAFELAVLSGMDFVETDVQLSSDGVPVLMHDESLDRTTNGTGLVRDFTLEELQKLDAGSWFSPEFAGVTIPTLEDFFDVVAPSGKKALVELKGYWTEDEVHAASDLAYASGMETRVVFASKHFTTIENLATAAGGFPRVIIQRDLPVDSVRLLQFYGAIALLTSVAAVKAEPEVIGELHEAGLGIVLYTLNREKRWATAVTLGVDGIVTDKPAELGSWLATIPKP